MPCRQVCSQVMDAERVARNGLMTNCASPKTISLSKSGKRIPTSKCLANTFRDMAKFTLVAVSAVTNGIP